MGIEELDARVSNTNRTWFPQLVIANVVEVSAQFLFINHIRTLTREDGELAHSSEIRGLGSFPRPVS